MSYSSYKATDVYHYKILQSLKPSDPRLDDFKIGGYAKIKEPAYTLSGESKTDYIWRKYKLIDVTSKGLYIFRSSTTPKGKDLMWKEILMMLNSDEIKPIT